MLLLFLQALIGMFLFRVFLLEGFRHTTSLEGGIITSTAPAILACLSFVILKERITKRIIAGIVSCVAGMLLINIQVTDAAVSTGHLYGNAIILLAVVCESLFSIFRKKQHSQDKPIISTTFIIFITLILFMPLGILDIQKTDMSVMTPVLWVSILFYGIFCTVIAYICWFKGIEKVDVSIAAGFTGLMPVTSVFLAATLLNETLTPKHIVGTFLTVTGILIIAMKKMRHLQLT